jgi:D-alanyl-D-alanine dipeptidase
MIMKERVEEYRDMKTWKILACVVSFVTGGLTAQVPAPKPPDVPSSQRQLIGEYIAGDTLIFFERGGGMWLGHLHGPADSLASGAFMSWIHPSGKSVDLYWRPNAGPDTLRFGGIIYRRRPLDAEDGATFRITPLFSAEQLIRRADAAKPPVESGTFRATELVELHSLDPTIRYDIRYASTNNFMGQQFYSMPRAYLQRPAAEAAARAHRWLAKFGYGLLAYDAYRPWRVTKMFWDATPNAMKEVFVANPSKGSRHNRGCALDAGLYHLDTGRPADMVSGYDEFSERAFPNYPGGTSLQRWHRELLKTALEQEGFKQYEWEWWHFDFAGWERWRIGVVSFEELEKK